MLVYGQENIIKNDFYDFYFTAIEKAVDGLKPTINAADSAYASVTNGNNYKTRMVDN